MEPGRGSWGVRRMGAETPSPYYVAPRTENPAFGDPGVPPLMGEAAPVGVDGDAPLPYSYTELHGAATYYTYNELGGGVHHSANHDMGPPFYNHVGVGGAGHHIAPLPDYAALMTENQAFGDPGLPPLLGEAAAVSVRADDNRGVDGAGTSNYYGGVDGAGLSDYYGGVDRADRSAYPVGVNAAGPSPYDVGVHENFRSAHNYHQGVDVAGPLAYHHMGVDGDDRSTSQMAAPHMGVHEDDRLSAYHHMGVDGDDRSTSQMAAPHMGVHGDDRLSAYHHMEVDGAAPLASYMGVHGAASSSYHQPVDGACHLSAYYIAPRTKNSTQAAGLPAVGAALGTVRVDGAIKPAGLPAVGAASASEGVDGAIEAAALPAFGATPASVGADDGAIVKKRRGRPRKYDPNRTVTMTLSMPNSSSAPCTANFSSEITGSGPSGGSKHRQHEIPATKPRGVWSAWINHCTKFTTCVITANPGEDVLMKFISLAEQGTQGTCIMSANGTITNVILRQADTDTGTFRYEGLFDIIRLSGTFMLYGDEGTMSGSMSIALRSHDGRVIAGIVCGCLIAASRVEVKVGRFRQGKKNAIPKKSQLPAPTTEIPPASS